MDLLQDTRYQKTPVYLFFEKYVLDVIGELPQDKREILQEIDLQATFGTQSTAWKDVIREVLQLSSTIDIAILDQWYQLIENAQTEALEINVNTFCRNFVDAYFEENSHIDVWTEESLNEAKIRIIANQALESA